MSVKALAWAFEQRTGDPGRQCVLLALADHTNANGECWPSMKRLADAAQVSERTARRHLDWLDQAGFITRGLRNRSNGGQASNLYKLNMRPANMGEGGCQFDRGPLSPVAGAIEPRTRRSEVKEEATRKESKTLGDRGYTRDGGDDPDADIWGGAA